MKPQSITFRCSDVQYSRIEKGMQNMKSNNRTELLSRALKEFLEFVEKKDVKTLDLRGLVERVDMTGARLHFSRYV